MVRVINIAVNILYFFIIVLWSLYVRFLWQTLLNGFDQKTLKHPMAELLLVILFDICGYIAFYKLLMEVIR